MKEQREYKFSAKERAYFNQLQAQFNASVNSAMALVINQQDLEGNWRMKADGSGLERADPPAAPMTLELLDAAPLKTNGLA